MVQDVHVRTKRALDAEQAAHAATRDRTVMRIVESKHALKAEQAAHAATLAELSRTKRALAEKSKTEPTEPTTEPTAEPTSKPASEPTSEPELTTEPI